MTISEVFVVSFLVQSELSAVGGTAGDWPGEWGLQEKLILKSHLVSNCTVDTSASIVISEQCSGAVVKWCSIQLRHSDLLLASWSPVGWDE